MYKAALQLNGFAVVAVADGVDALRHIDETPPDVVVLDLGLPRLGGHDVQREVAGHAETSAIPIVVVTGGDVQDLDPRAFVCVLRKPIDVDALVRAVRRCLASGASRPPPSSGGAGTVPAR